MQVSWQLGDKQRTDDNNDVCIRIELPNERVLTFSKTTVEERTIKSKESWGVLRYDAKSGTQTTVNVNMDKASALMVAKRLSDEDRECIYTAALIRDVVEAKTEITPYKAFKANGTIGKLTQ